MGSPRAATEAYLLEETSPAGAKSGSLCLMISETLFLLALTALFAAACALFGTLWTVGALFAAIAIFIAWANLRRRRRRG